MSAQGLNLTTLSQSSVALNALFRAVFACSSLGIISGTLSAESLHSGYSVRAVVEFGIPDDVGNELLGILIDSSDVLIDINNSQ